MVYDKVKYLCTKDGISITALEKKLGFGKGTITKWKKSSPRIDKVVKLAKYFNLKIDDFFSKNKI